MSGGPQVLYESDAGVARVTLNRPERGNAITPRLLAGLVECVERADLDPQVHVVLLRGSGEGFCAGYDLLASAERMHSGGLEDSAGGAPADATDERARGRGGSVPVPAGSPIDPAVVSANHDPSRTWDPMVDYAMMSRNVRAFMTLFHCSKPVLCSVHGYCVAGGTDMALCSDLLIAASDAKIGYPPARVWGSPTTAMWAHRVGAARAKRLLFTGDCLSGTEALEWGLAIEAPAPAQLEERTEALLERIARVPVNQLAMMKLLVNQSLFAQGLHSTQLLGTLFDGIARHTPEGYAFQHRAAEAGYREAVRERDEPFGDAGRSTFKG